MEIPLGLIPRLMTYLNWEAWRKVKIEGNREKFPSGVFRRCNLGNERKRGPILQLEERPVGSPNPDPASHVLQVRRDPVPNYRLLPELRYRSRARNGQRLGHRNLDRLRAGKRKPPRPDQSKQQCRIRPPLALNSQAATSFPKINKGRSAAYCSRKHPTYTIVKSSAWVGIRVMVREWFQIFFASIFGLVLEMSRGTELVVESFLVIDTRRISFNSYVTIHSEVALFLMS
ncbi:hypothetical protein VNO77_46925 [Canavalia gladiata]